jgi:hypothetical protein
MGTIIHGIASSQHLDSSGEVVDISGLDISSLAKDGVLNWAHKKDTPSQVVGKILKAKKIFSEADCENKDELYFWKKSQLPFVYVIGELFDAQGHTEAQNLAAMFRYDHENKDKNLNNVVGFSVEGGKISTKDNVVTHSVARKVTIDTFPCNKIAIARLKPQTDASKNSIDDFFKSEGNFAVEIFNGSYQEKVKELIKKEDPSKHAKKLGIEPFKKDSIGITGGSLALDGSGPTSAGGLLMSEKLPGQVGKTTEIAPKNSLGAKIGTTSGGHDVFSHAKPYHYKTATAKDHKEIADIHYGASQEKGNKNAKRHLVASQWHQNAAINMENRLKKTMDAGSGMAAPSNLTQGAALASESLDKKINKKSKWLARAEEEYDNWDKKEDFRKYMANKLPNLATCEIDAIGRAMVLNRAMEMERSLRDIVNNDEDEE